MDDEGLSRILAAARAKGPALRWTVIGAGNGGLAMAGHLGLMGFPVQLYNRSDERLAGVRWHGGVRVDGEARGFGPVELATSDMTEALLGADVVMVATPSTAHRSLAALMAPCLADGQLVVLNPGRTGGALEFRKVLIDAGAPGRPLLAEAQTFIYASRATSRFEAHIFKIKNGLALAALPSWRTPEALGILEAAFPQFKAGGTVLATSMENIGAVFHPALTLLNAGWIESTGGDFEYYLGGITPSIARVLERIDEERLAVARALGVRSLSAREWLYLSYDSSGRDLHEAILNTDAYRGIKAPPAIDHRYVTEDVPMSLVPISSLGTMLGAPTPTIDMVIELAHLLLGTDFRASGRTVESLGLAGLSVQDIHRIATETGL
ncbi:MAG: NAD/NADP octopine/nopaline dehydrogenase family protein [Spirochaetes bacterium]|nr:NAD/NADP octopine/nopaline dehydrogenase family protein [Spirochaetota bacterium]